MPTPLISVIVPSYQRAFYLGQTLDSVFAQTLKNIEVIVVEDGSHDAGDVLARFGDRVHYLWQPNSGAGSARNLGARHARGEWLAFVDDDDMWMPTKLERQLEAAARQPEMGLFHTDHYALIDGELRTPPRMPPRGRVPTGLVAKELFLNNFIVTSSVMIRRSEFMRIKGFSAATRFGEDLELWLRFAHEFPVGFVPEQLTIYRDHEHSLSSQLVWQEGFPSMMRQCVRDNPWLYTDLGHAVVKNTLRNINWRGAYAHMEAKRCWTAARLFTNAWIAVPSDLRPLLYAAACVTGKHGVSLLRVAKQATS